MASKDIQERDAAYRAIGRYIVEFSSLVLVHAIPR